MGRWSIDCAVYFEGTKGVCEVAEPGGIMPTKERLIIYGIGFCLGLIVVYFCFSGRFISLPKSEKKAGVSDNVFLAEVIHRSQPIPLSWALFNKDELVDTKGAKEVYRTLIIEGTEAIPYWRVEEVLDEVAPGKLKLVSRKVMAADIIEGRLGDIEKHYEVAEKVKELGFKILGKAELGRTDAANLEDGLIFIKIKTHGPDDVNKACVKVEAVMPGVFKDLKPYAFLEYQEEANIEMRKEIL